MSNRLLRIAPPPKNSRELTEERSQQTKIFDLGNGQQKLQHFLGPVHYQETPGQGPWLDIDLTPRDNGTHWVIDRAPYILKIDKQTLEIDYTSRQGGNVRFKPKRIGNKPFSDFTPPAFEQDDSDRVWFKNIDTDLDLYLEVKPNGVEWFKVLRSENAASEFEWEIDRDPVMAGRQRLETIGWDNKPDAVTKRARKLDVQNTRSNIQHANGREKFTVTETVKREPRVSQIVDPRTRQKSWTYDVQYPLIVDVPDVTENIVSGSDDVFTYQTYSFGPSVFTNFDFIAAGTDAFFENNGGLRFQSVAIPQGQTIQSAILKTRRFSITGTFVNPPQIFGVDTDNMGTIPSGTADPVKFRPKTTAQADLNTGSGTQSHTVTSIVQEIVNRVGWASNNDIGFALTAGANSTASLRLDAYERTGGTPAVLEVTFGATAETISVDAASLSLTQQASTVLTDETVLVDLATLSVTQQSPTVNDIDVVPIDLATLSLTQQNLKINVTVPVERGTLSVTQQAPTILADEAIPIDLAELSITQQETKVNETVPVDLESLTLIAEAASINESVSVDLATLSLTQQSPTVNAPETISVDLSSVSLSAFEATVSVEISGGPIVFGTVSTGGNTTSSATYSHDATGADVLIVGVTANGSGSFTVTYNGVSMTAAEDGSAGGTSADAAIFYLVNPASGSNTVSVSHDDGATTRVNSVAVNVTGVDTSNPIGNVVDTSSTATASITLSAGSAAVSCGYDVAGSAPNAATGNTLLGSESNGFRICNLAERTETSAGTYTAGFDTTQDALVVVEFNEATGLVPETVAVDLATLSLTAQTATVSEVVPIDLDTLSLTQQASKINETIPVDAQSLTLAQQDVNVNETVPVDAQSLTLAGQAATISADAAIAVGLATLELTAQAATIDDVVQVDLATLSLTQLESNVRESLLVENIPNIDLIANPLTVNDIDIVQIDLAELTLAANAVKTNDTVPVETQTLSFTSFTTSTDQKVPVDLAELTTSGLAVTVDDLVSVNTSTLTITDEAIEIRESPIIKVELAQIGFRAIGPYLIADQEQIDYSLPVIYTADRVDLTADKTRPNVWTDSTSSSTWSEAEDTSTEWTTLARNGDNWTNQ